MGDKIGAAKHESSQENLTESGVGLKNSPQTLPADFQDRTRFAGPASDQAASSRELIHLAGKHPARQHPDYALVAGNTDDLDAALQHDENTMSRVAQIEQDGACVRQALLPEGRESRNLRVVQRGEHRIGL